jgi:hypothetical protein
MQIVWLFVLATPVACVAWTVTHEEAFREPRDYCTRQSQYALSAPKPKFFYLFTCEYCFNHYVAAFFLIVTRYKLLYSDRRGYLIAFFALNMGCEPVYERFRAATPRHTPRTHRDQRRGRRSQREDRRSLSAS